MPDTTLPEALRDPALPPPRGMVVTDLDGTLLGSGGEFLTGDLAALAEAGRKGFFRAIATGRSLYSYDRLRQGRRLPVDCVVFSSGCGVRCLPGGEILERPGLAPEEVAGIALVLLDEAVDFMIHDPVPANHRFAHRAGGGGCTDFGRRLEWYEGCHRPFEGAEGAHGEASQFLVIVSPERGEAILDRIGEALPDFNVIRTTSPLDGRTVWIEIFPATVSKGRTVGWLARGLGLTPSQVLAVGNDYNDLDLLEFAGTSYVVSNAPAELRRIFPTVPRNDRGGVARAIERWLADPGVC